MDPTKTTDPNAPVAPMGAPADTSTPTMGDAGTTTQTPAPTYQEPTTTEMPTAPAEAPVAAPEVPAAPAEETPGETGGMPPVGTPPVTPTV